VKYDVLKTNEAILMQIGTSGWRVNFGVGTSMVWSSGTGTEVGNKYPFQHDVS